MKPPGDRPRSTPWQGMLITLLIGVLWVFGGDVLLGQMVDNAHDLARYTLWKRWLFVLLTTVLAGWLLWRANRTERARHAVSDELSRVLQVAPVGIGRVAPDGRLLWANRALCQLLDTDAATVPTLRFPEVVPAADPAFAQHQRERLLGGDLDHYVAERTVLRQSDGAAVPVLCTLTRVPDQDDEAAASHLVCVLQDLREIRSAQDALAASEARQRLAFTAVDNSLEGVVVTDAQSRILSVNAAVTRVLGYAEDELLGRTPRVFKSDRHDAAFYRAMWAEVLRTGHWKGEIWNRRKNGEVFPEHMSLSAVRDPAGQITHYVCVFSDITEEKAQQQKLEFLAHNDALTGLFNRSWFTQRLQRAVREAKASREPMAVLLLNLDRFKDVNDSYGQSVGDQVLNHIARQLQLALRPGDQLGRLAGDELAVLARSVRDADDAAAVARRMIAAVGEPWVSPDGLAVVAGASVGICLYPSHAQDAEALLQGAHAAMYGAKARGRGAWCFFTEDMTATARARLALESRLRVAVAQGQLEMYYQPQVSVETGLIMGAEALVRWNDPDEGLISPAAFIPVAETSGLIGALGEWVLRDVCRQGQVWREEGLPPLLLALNVSPRQFQLTNLVAVCSDALQTTGYPATLLELEITEGTLAERPEEALRDLQALKQLGVRLAVDDFGTGYSSLAQLKRFPIDILKIDQGFIRDIPRSADDMAISAAIIGMGHNMGMSVLAEGVETPQQLAFLREHGCDTYQGYLRSRPVPADQFAALVRAQMDAAAEHGVAEPA